MKLILSLNILLISILQAQAGETGKFCGISCSPEQELAKYTSFAQNIPQNNCPKNLTPSTDSPMALGARKVIALTYGNCEALQLPVRDKMDTSQNNLNLKGSKPVYLGYKYNNHEVWPKVNTQIANSNPYLKSLQTQGCSTKSECSKESINKVIPGISPVCKKLTCEAILNPPLYQYGGKVDGDDSLVPHKKLPDGGEVNGMDCSFFILNAMKASGLKRAPNDPINDVKGSKDWDTKDFAKLGQVDPLGKPLDCFERLDSTTDVKPGDIIVAPNSHIVMVDTVGKDPFGIDALLRKSNDELYAIYKENEYSNPKDKTVINAALEGTSKLSRVDSLEILDRLSNIICRSQLDATNFKITIAHSSPHGNNVGVQRETVGSGLSGALESTFFLKAWNSCVSAFQEKWESKNPGLINSSKERTAAIDNYLTKSTVDNSPKMIRHVPGRDGCTTTIPEVPGMGCANCCDLSASYEKLTGEPK